ncbi:hypothetical protein CDAR_393131 [Caerostris darwini]|uniref:Uncharacterized protein n=1 Tax=Caerostris darwini TaxID=1538125 RepID=A0AAV4RS84_9ARAC|nr:hypothetical protein CDAR_393131 [Caerostris darwini]
MDVERCQTSSGGQLIKVFVTYYGCFILWMVYMDALYCGWFIWMLYIVDGLYGSFILWMVYMDSLYCGCNFSPWLQCDKRLDKTKPHFSKLLANLRIPTPS